MSSRIIDTPAGDYGFRAVVTKEELATIFSTLADSIDYSNFKDCVASVPSQRAKLRAYHNFWSDMLKVQTLGNEA